MTRIVSQVANQLESFGSIERRSMNGHPFLNLVMPFVAYLCKYTLPYSDAIGMELTPPHSHDNIIAMKIELR